MRVDRVTSTVDHTHSVFVGNVPFSADEEQLRQLFQLVLTCISVFLPHLVSPQEVWGGGGSASDQGQENWHW